MNSEQCVKPFIKLRHWKLQSVCEWLAPVNATLLQWVAVIMGPTDLNWGTFVPREDVSQLQRLLWRFRLGLKVQVRGGSAGKEPGKWFYEPMEGQVCVSINLQHFEVVEAGERSSGDERQIVSRQTPETWESERRLKGGSQQKNNHKLSRSVSVTV